MSPATITCREVVDALDDYRGGALPPRQRARFDTHLAGCAQCSAYLESYAAAIRLTREALGEPSEKDPPLPDALTERILRHRNR